MKVRKTIFVWDIKTKRKRVKENKKQKILFEILIQREKSESEEEKNNCLKYKKTNNGEAPWPRKEPKQLEYNKCGEIDAVYLIHLILNHH